jgi:hypothetical protein
MKLKLIKSSKSKFTRITNYIAIGLILILILKAIYFKIDAEIDYINLVILILFVGLILFKGFRSFVIKDFIVLGAIDLGTKSIHLKTDDLKEVFQFEQIRSLQVKYFGYEGEAYPLMLNSGGGKSGEGNIIRILTKTEMYTFQFFLQNWRDRINLFKHLKYYESKGLNIAFKNEFGRNDIYKKV